MTDNRYSCIFVLFWFVLFCFGWLVRSLGSLVVLIGLFFVSNTRRHCDNFLQWLWTVSNNGLKTPKKWSGLDRLLAGAGMVVLKMSVKNHIFLQQNSEKPYFLTTKFSIVEKFRPHPLGALPPLMHIIESTRVTPVKQKYSDSASNKKEILRSK